MLFASRRTWVDPSSFDLIAKEDGLRRLAEGESRVVGDVALLRGRGGEVVHVGLVVEIRVGAPTGAGLRLLSQFGADGEYFHDDDDIPWACAWGAGPC